MMQSASQIVHTVPGRIRVRLPALKDYPDYETVLQKQLQSLSGVKVVRINPSAHSLIVQYDSQLMSEATFNTTLIAALQSTSPIDLQSQTISLNDYSSPEKLPPDCEPIQLTTYEEIQFEAIKVWKHRQIKGIKAIVGQLLMASRRLFNFLFLDKALEKVGGICEQATANWQQDWEKLRSLGGIEEAIELRQGTLEKCDQLSEQVTKGSENQATLQGSLDGLLDVFGEVADEGLTLILALQTIHRIGLCYGYAPQTPDEQAFAWAIFNAAIAQTQEEFENVQITLRYLQQSLNKQALTDETLQDTLEEDVEDLLVDSAIEQGVALLTGETFAGVVPIFSILMSVFADRNLVDDVSEAAKREFQQRWLLENQKICFPESSHP